MQCTKNCMKIGKASETSGIAIELFKAGEDKCLKSLTNIFNNVLSRDKLLQQWLLNLLVPILKGKGDPLNPNSYRGIKHVFKLYKVLDRCLRKMVDIDKMQYGFMLERWTVDAVLVLRRLSEKFSENKKLFFMFVDLEKAFDRVSREVICFVLRQKGVLECLVNGVMTLYKDRKTTVSVDGELSNSSSTKLVSIKGLP